VRALREVERQPIIRKAGYATRCQLMGECLCTRTESKRWDDLAAGITGDPQPSNIHLSADLEPEFIELDIGQLEGAH
jgi:hypothetical protein